MKTTTRLFIAITALLLICTPHEASCRKIRLSLKTTTRKENTKVKSGIKTTKVKSGNVSGMTLDGTYLQDSVAEPVWLPIMDVFEPVWLPIMDADTIQFEYLGEDNLFVTSSVRFAGYDKTATSSKETFHIINGSPYHISGAALRIVYKDMKGRMLHSREITVTPDIPAGETRMVEIPTWDTQKSFYYHLSNAPRRTAAPYQITLTPLSYLLLPPKSPHKPQAKEANQAK